MANADNGGLHEFLKSIPFETIGQYYKQAVDYGVVDVALHPFDYADTLIRLGYEPFPPHEESPIFFGKKSLVLPGIISYIQYLYSIDGSKGMFRAVVPFVTGNLIYRHLSAYIMKKSPYPIDPPEGEPRLSQQFTDANVGHFVKVRFWRMLSNLVGLHAAYPFHAIAIRSMARFVTSVGASKEGYRPEMAESWINELRRVKGFDELFAGCQARIIKEITFAVIAGASFLTMMKVLQVIKTDPQQADQFEQSIEYLGNSIALMYITPFRNASDIMVINKTDIPLGNPPFNEHYSSCWECCKKLRKDRKWKTSGSRGIFQSGRNYNGKIMEKNGRLIPIGYYFGPVYLPKHAHGLDDLPNSLRGHYEAWNDMGGVFDAGITGMGTQLIDENHGRKKSDDLALGGIKPIIMSCEQAPMDILGLGSKSFYFYGSSSNPFGL